MILFHELEKNNEEIARLELLEGLLLDSDCDELEEIETELSRLQEKNTKIKRQLKSMGLSDAI